MQHEPILAIEHLSVGFPGQAGNRQAGDGLVLRDVSLNLTAGETLCLVGESGSGKSMTARAVMRLLPPNARVEAGRILFGGRDLLALDEAQMRGVRGAEIGMVFQEPMTALNPLQRIGAQIGEVFRLHTQLSRAEIRERAMALLQSVHIREPERVFRAYPHEISGGQRQRAMIAMALALEPKVLIADEPTTALDVTTQARVLDLIREIQQRTGAGILFITHDFGVVSDIADRVVVMNEGKVVETGETRRLLEAPQDPYTRKLIQSVPSFKAAAAPRPLGGEALRVEGLAKTYRRKGLAGIAARPTYALKPTDLPLAKGSTLGIVGESGSGKSTLARCIVRLLDADSGAIWIKGTDYMTLSRRELRKRADTIQMVFQDPFSSLNPRRRVGDLVAQGLVVKGEPRRKALARARELFDLVGLDPSTLERYPHEFSGGQRQRIGLARALALQPEVLVADEPVSALDVSIQAQVLELLASLQKKLDLSMIFITHDLRVAAQICDRVAVMRQGEIVEEGAVASVFADPQHAYTRLLLDSVPGRKWTPLGARTGTPAAETLEASDN